MSVQKLLSYKLLIIKWQNFFRSCNVDKISKNDENFLTLKNLRNMVYSKAFPAIWEIFVFKNFHCFQRLRKLNKEYF